MLYRLPSKVLLQIKFNYFIMRNRTKTLIGLKISVFNLNDVMVSVYNTHAICSLCQIHIPSAQVPETKVFECQLYAAHISDELAHIIGRGNFILHILIRLINSLPFSEA